MKSNRIISCSFITLSSVVLNFSSVAQNEVPATGETPAQTVPDGKVTPPSVAQVPAVPASGLTLMAIVGGSVDFTTFVAAVKAAGLEETLTGEGTFTLFAPRNDAFAALPQATLAALMAPANVEALKAVLTYHLLPQRMPAAGLVAGRTLTVQGELMTFTADREAGITIQGASIIQKDVLGKNGVIHVVNKVLVPPSMDLANLRVPAR